MTSSQATAPRRGRRWVRGLAVELGFMAAIGVLGALVLLPLHWGLAVLELALTAISPLWMMLRVCPHCTVHGSEACPSGFGVISERLAGRRDTALFAQAFAHNVYGVMPMWFLPVAGAALMAWRGIGVPLVPLALFVLLAFVATPLRARLVHCKRCPRRGDCPWALRTMGPPPGRTNGSAAGREGAAIPREGAR